jgi:uncharacterized protein YjbJ (UPF0337 family)
MRGRTLRGNWDQMKTAVLEHWSRVTAEDIAHLAGEREALMRVLKDRYEKSYGEIEREVAEFEMRDLRTGYAARLSRGIGPNGRRPVREPGPRRGMKPNAAHQVSRSCRGPSPNAITRAAGVPRPVHAPASPPCAPAVQRRRTFPARHLHP